MGLIKEGEVLAQVTVNYPVSELGNCASKQACKAYCNIPTNYQACTNFAKSKGIIKIPTPLPTSITDSGSKNLGNLKFPISELGNCSSAQDCKNYCNQSANRQACFEFGRKQGLTGNQEAAGKLGGLQFPIAELGGCENFAACEVYCDTPGHRQVCSNFAKAHGFEPPKDKRGPGGCTSDEECQKFCQANPNNVECNKGRDEFCQANPDKCKKGPGGCTSDEECKKYCQNNPTNEECKKGKEEYCQKNPDQCQEQKGPGGCVSEEECKKYCQANPNDPECQKNKIQYCQEHPQECQDNQGGSGPKTGPGGCQSDEECKKYCEQPEHKTECQQFGGDYCLKNPNDEKCQVKNTEGPKTGQGQGPGGCSSPEECAKYCEDPLHQSECQKGAPESCEQNPNQAICQGGQPPAGSP